MANKVVIYQYVNHCSFLEINSYIVINFNHSCPLDVL